MVTLGWSDENGEEEYVVRIPEAGDVLLTAEEVADMLNVSEATLRQWATIGKGPPYYGWAQTPFYRSVEVEHWLLDELMSEPKLKVLR
jgi:hypothetical protein